MTNEIKITKRDINGRPIEAESNLFSWMWLNDSYLHCKTTGKTICQMAYLRNTFGSDPIADEATRNAILDFWEQLRAIDTAAREQAEKAEYEAALAEAMRQTPERERKARAYDNLYNEGAEGYNPYR